jgi:hypothetical protein
MQKYENKLTRHQKHNIHLSGGNRNSTRMVDKELLVIPKVCLISSHKIVKEQLLFDKTVKEHAKVTNTFNTIIHSPNRAKNGMQVIHMAF